MKIVRFFRSAVWCVFLACFIITAPARAQQVTAAITGRVTDPTGAAVTNANVTATDKDRGTEWPTTTNGEGVFNLPRLPVGTYDVKATHPGFEAATVSSVLLQLNQVARLDIPLTV